MTRSCGKCKYSSHLVINGSSGTVRSKSIIECAISGDLQKTSDDCTIPQPLYDLAEKGDPR